MHSRDAVRTLFSLIKTVTVTRESCCALHALLLCLYIVVSSLSLSLYLPTYLRLSIYLSIFLFLLLLLLPFLLLLSLSSPHHFVLSFSCHSFALWHQHSAFELSKQTLALTFHIRNTPGKLCQFTLPTLANRFAVTSQDQKRRVEKMRYENKAQNELYE